MRKKTKGKLILKVIRICCSPCDALSQTISCKGNILCFLVENNIILYSKETHSIFTYFYKTIHAHWQQHPKPENVDECLQINTVIQITVHKSWLQKWAECFPNNKPRLAARELLFTDVNFDQLMEIKKKRGKKKKKQARLLFFIANYQEQVFDLKIHLCKNAK